MISVVFARSDDGTLDFLRCTGHAEFAEADDGGDVVCAAFSALTGYLGIAFAENLGRPEAVVVDHGLFELRVPGDLSADDRKAATLVLETWLKAVLSLEENYRGWVKVGPES